MTWTFDLEAAATPDMAQILIGQQWVACKVLDVVHVLHWSGNVELMYTVQLSGGKMMHCGRNSLRFSERKD